MENLEDIVDLTAKFLAVGLDLQSLCAADPEFGRIAHHSLYVIRKALDEYTPSKLALCFNGGKDATCILFLLMVVLAERNELERLCGTNLDKIIVAYFDEGQHSEARNFTVQMARMYHLTMRYYKMGIDKGIADLVTTFGRDAVFLGTRKGDTGAYDLDDLSPSAENSPLFVRVHPILNWPSASVWHFIRHHNLPYCCLYDQEIPSFKQQRIKKQSLKCWKSHKCLILTSAALICAVLYFRTKTAKK